jgi:hypothetical protein
MPLWKARRMDSGRTQTVGRRALVIAALAAVSGSVVAVSRDAGVPAAPGSGGASPGSPRPGRRPRPAPAGEPPASRGRAGAVRASPAHAPTPAPTLVPTPAPTPIPAELPRGGRHLFPTYRLIGYSGGPGSAAFGRLGVGDLDTRVREIESLGMQFAGGRRPLPVLELIAVIAQPKPGPDGRYRVRAGADVVQTYLAAARRHRALLLLNIQPGRARFMDEVVALEPWLRQPDVGLALDPEWAVRSGQVPGRVFGRTTGAEIDAVARYVSELVTRLDLPDKPLVVHQLAPDVVRGQWAVKAHPGVAVIKSVDGIGPPGAKVTTWRTLVTDLPPSIRPGFKLFFDEDAAGPARIMTPAEVMALTPTPDYVLYE